MSVAYFSKMFQAVPHLAQVHSALPGTFVTTRRSTLNAAKKHYPDMPATKYSRLLGGLAKGNRALEAAEVIVSGSPYREFLGDYPTKRKCSVFHGTYMMLSRDALEKNSHYDLLCVIGPRMQTMIDRFAPELMANSVMTGFLPFCEYPEPTPSLRQATLSRLGLDPAKRTIVYTPSRRGVGSWDVVAERLVETAPAEFNLILRPHPSQALTGRAKDRASFRRVRASAKARTNTLLDLTSEPLSLLLAICDLVVSDANSPAEESLFYDRPLLLLESDNLSKDVLIDLGTRERMHPDDLEKLLTLFDCGPTLRANPTMDFSIPLNEALTSAHTFAECRNDYFSWVFGSRDRLANVRVAEAIKKNLL